MLLPKQVSIAVACMFFLPGGDATDKHCRELQSAIVRVNNKTLRVEVARTWGELWSGLSRRTEMAEDQGMLFVFPEERVLTFSMRNTLIPLSIAFLSSDMQVQKIMQMEVGSHTVYSSNKLALYALEVNQGWFKGAGLEFAQDISVEYGPALLCGNSDSGERSRF